MHLLHLPPEILEAIVSLATAASDAEPDTESDAESIFEYVVTRSYLQLRLVCSV